MSVLLRLCYSIIRRNKGFTICILLMSILSVSIGFLGADFGASSESTIKRFIEESFMPDVFYLTDIITKEDIDAIKKIDGIKNVSDRFIFDTVIETKDEMVYSVRMYRQKIDSPYKQIIHSKAEYKGDLPQLSISKEFADYHKMLVGDHIFISTPNGKKEVVIKAIVSSPETIKCVKDEMSSYEGYQFAYLYCDEDEFKKMIDVGEISNQLLVYFDDELDINDQKQCMKKISESLAEHVIQETFTIESEELITIQDDLNTIGVICKFVPGIIWLIGLGFNFIFIKIIVNNQRKTIGLLRALGYRISKVVLIFVLYTVLINIPALIIGVLLGYRLLEMCLMIISNSYGIIHIVISILPLKTVFMSLMVFVIGVIATLLSSSSISAIDPSEAYDGMNNSSYEPPTVFLKLDLDSFVKISVVSLFRNYKRQIIGSLCISACIVSMCVGLQGVLTIGHPIDAVYGDRYRYDLMIRNINKETINKIDKEITGIISSEAATVFSAKILDKDVKVSTINENDKLTVLKNADGEIVFPGDGIIIDEMYAKINDISVGDIVKLNDLSLRVNGIAREILHTVMYINEENAKKLGYENNCLLLKLDKNTDINKLEEKISDVDKEAYFVEFASQKENIKDSFMAMRTIMFVFAVLAFFIGSLLVINITIIDFNENKIKYAILRAIGTPVKRLGIVSFIQNGFRILLGIVIAVPFSYICNTILLELLSNASQQYVMVHYNECFIISCLFPLLYVLFGVIISLSKIRNLDFCKCLNEME